jgi:hypothetical protein
MPRLSDPHFCICPPLETRLLTVVYLLDYYLVYIIVVLLSSYLRRCGWQQ